MTEPSISFDEAARRAKAGDADAQYALSSVLHQRGEWDVSLHWLRRAAKQGHTAARLTLATFMMDGRRCARDLPRASVLLEQLAATESRANLLLSELHGFAALGGNDRAAALQYLCVAARHGDSDGLRQLAMLSACHGQTDHVRSLIEESARRGDATAKLLRQEYFGSERIGPPLPPINWSALRETLPQLAADLPIPATLELSRAPLIRRLPGLIHPMVLDMIIHWAAPQLVRSQIVDARTGEVRSDPMRNSFHVTFGPRQHDHVLEALERCISRICGRSVQNGEFLQVIRYRVGEEFRPHVDYFNDTASARSMSLHDGGQRVQTVLLYLNKGYRGGETYFPRLGLTIAPRQGDLVHFHNVSANGQVDRDSLHAGLPVTTGEKWLLSQWIRAEIYRPRAAW